MITCAPLIAIIIELASCRDHKTHRESTVSRSLLRISKRQLATRIKPASATKTEHVAQLGIATVLSKAVI